MGKRRGEKEKPFILSLEKKREKKGETMCLHPIEEEKREERGI